MEKVQKSVTQWQMTVAGFTVKRLIPAYLYVLNIDVLYLSICHLPKTLARLRNHVDTTPGSIQKMVIVCVIPLFYYRSFTVSIDGQVSLQCFMYKSANLTFKFNIH